MASAPRFFGDKILTKDLKTRKLQFKHVPLPRGYTNDPLLLQHHIACWTEQAKDWGLEDEEAFCIAAAPGVILKPAILKVGGKLYLWHRESIDPTMNAWISDWSRLYEYIGVDDPTQLMDHLCRFWAGDMGSGQPEIRLEPVLKKNQSGAFSLYA